MADQGRWFKLWCSAAGDPDLDNLSVADFGRYCKLGVYVKEHGTDGTMVINAPSRTLCAALQVADFDALTSALLRLHNVDVRRAESETAESVSLVVTFRNWWKYQADYSTPRVSKFRQVKRSKRRREETRREETRGEVAPPPISGGSDATERRTGRPAPKPISRVKSIRIGRTKLRIPPMVRPVVDVWAAGFEIRFGRTPEPPKPWDLTAALELVERHGVEEVLVLVSGAMRVGTKRMRDGERWSLQAIQDDWNTLTAMAAKGELR